MNFFETFCSSLSFLTFLSIPIFFWSFGVRAPLAILIGLFNLWLGRSQPLRCGWRPVIVRKWKAWEAGGQYSAEILVVSWSGVVYILALSGKEGKVGKSFVLKFFKDEQLNYIQGGASLNTAISWPSHTIVKPSIALASNAPTCRKTMKSS